MIVNPKTLRRLSQCINLNLGCGIRSANKKAFNVDSRKTSITDLVFDLSRKHWPFKSNRFDNVYAFDILEHFVYVLPVMDEIWRVTKPGGFLHIRTTYFNTEQSYRDPTHLHYFTLESFDYWDPDTTSGRRYPYSKHKWKVLKKGVDGQETVFLLRKII